MRLLVNHQLIPVPIQSNSISLEQMLLKISIYCSNFTVLSSLFDVKKERPTMNLEKYYQFSVNIEISLDIKVYFSLVTCKINNLIALRLTNQITEISATWWLQDKRAWLCNGFTFRCLHIAMTSICNGHVPFEMVVYKCFINKDKYFPFSWPRLPMFTRKATIFFGSRLQQTISARRQGFLR